MRSITDVFSVPNTHPRVIQRNSTICTTLILKKIEINRDILSNLRLVYADVGQLYFMRM